MSPQPRSGDERCERADLIGPLVLGGLDESEVVPLRAHIDGCPVCQRHERELRPVARALAGVSGAAADRASDPSLEPGPHVLHAVLLGATQVRRARRRWQRPVAAAAALLLVAGISFGLGRVRRESSPHVGERIELVSAPGVKAWAWLATGPSGTYVDLRSRGLPSGELYRLWFEDPKGQRIPIGSFVSLGDKWVRCGASGGFGLDELAAVGASDKTGRTVLRADFYPKGWQPDPSGGPGDSGDSSKAGGPASAGSAGSSPTPGTAPRPQTS